MRGTRATARRTAHAAALLCLGLGACTAALQEQSVFVAPGKFDFLTCRDIAQRDLAYTAREKELNSLMDRANQEAAGPLVNAMVYASDLAQVRAEQRQLRRTAVDKKCGEPQQPYPPPGDNGEAVHPPPQPSPARGEGARRDSTPLNSTRDAAERARD